MQNEITKKEELYRAALMMVARHGYHGASIGTIARIAGMSKANIYHYAPGKSELITVALDHSDIGTDKSDVKYFAALQILLGCKDGPYDLLAAANKIIKESYFPGASVYFLLQLHKKWYKDNFTEEIPF